LTPVAGEGNDPVFDIHARQTRLNVKATLEVEEGEMLEGFVEIDFMVNPLGNERVSNSYAPRLRHAFAKYRGLLIGQTWSTFQDVKTLPESLDFVGTTDGVVFVRQPMIRYSIWGFDVAIENPETTATPFGGGTRIVTDDNELPDIVARYNHKGGDLSLVGAALIRSLSYNDGASIDSSETAVAFSLTGKMMLGKDDVRFGINTGSGMGRYIGLNISNGAVIDASGELEAIDSTGIFASYRHVMDGGWRTNVIFSTISIDNDTALTGTGANESATRVAVNVMNSPVKNLTLGVELSQATLEKESGAEGDMSRLQFTAKLGF